MPEKKQVVKGKPMSACNPELVSAYLDNELDDIIVEKVTDHLIKCENCKKLLGVLTQVRDSLTDSFSLKDSDGVTSSVMASIEQEPSHGEAASTSTPFMPTIFNNDYVRFIGVPAALAAASLVAWNQLSTQPDPAQMVAGNEKPSQYSSSEGAVTVDFKAPGNPTQK